MAAFIAAVQCYGRIHSVGVPSQSRRNLSRLPSELGLHSRRSGRRLAKPARSSLSMSWDRWYELSRFALVHIVYSRIRPRTHGGGAYADCLIALALQNYGDALCNFAKSKDADVLVIGHGGHSAAKMTADAQQPKLGSTTEHCAAECGCNLLITKGEGRWNLGADLVKLSKSEPAPEPEPES